MRTMVLDSPGPAEKGPLHLRDLPLPQPAAGQLRVRVRCCGLCHTDLHTVEGDLDMHKRPVIPGHQIVGVVDALGPAVTAFREGDRVGIPWLYSTCGRCFYCRHGLENLCEFARFTGWDADGGYAEAAVVGQDFAYAIPPAFDDEHAAPLLCAGIIGYRSLRLSNVKPGERLGLYGFGASAHIVIQLARHLGCEVLVFTRSTEHRRLATELGASWTGASTDMPPEPLDSAIIFAPLGALVPDALRALRKGGTLALAGITMSEIPAMDYALLYGERIVRSVANSTRQDARELLDLSAQVPVRTEAQSYPLEDANRALQDLKASRIRGAGVLRVSG
jgi:propanol-preferring alcohol dehydrogenase